MNENLEYKKSEIIIILDYFEKRYKRFLKELRHILNSGFYEDTSDLYKLPKRKITEEEKKILNYFIICPSVSKIFDFRHDYETNIMRSHPCYKNKELNYSEKICYEINILIEDILPEIYHSIK